MRCITGAARGQGRSHAPRLAREGAVPTSSPRRRFRSDFPARTMRNERVGPDSLFSRKDKRDAQ
jgi:NAD(P)-dependent dehydrogenase (short-subunit alcohol dehydrogenase family)